MTVIVNEIFYSLQGESTHAGRPCVFVRLTGCNLRCDYCDTQYAYEEGLAMEIPGILLRVSEYGCRLVEITGGEPLVQKETPALITSLLDAGHEVLLETNGSLDIASVDERCVKIMDVKCPSSREDQSNRLENLKGLNPRDQVKFVVQNRKDYEFAKTILPLIPRALPFHQVLFSPVVDQLAPRILAEWMLEDRLAARLQVQLHKIIWPEFDRGV
ncbi:MAG: radical SAM protein [Proteobacteria bacterium]|nr:radical SAM protein [Pseudomonadota bacterium]MBU4470185.1 radical SAM protein [Pseudomonadota bacterium]MCG2750450.1 radical SAM protein [Desulfobacteraceae bacterium]